MRILLTAATRAEIAPLTEYMGARWQAAGADRFVKGAHQIKVLISGVGMTATAYRLTRLLGDERFDLALQAGIAGSFDRTVPLGSVVRISDEVFADLGAEDHYQFRDIFDLGLEQPDLFPFSQKRLIAPEPELPPLKALTAVPGLTVNMVTGSSFTATQRLMQFNCVTESMEGAPFHYVCLQEKLPFVQIRSISNYVEARNRADWRIGEAVANLNDFLTEFMDSLA